MTIGRFGAMVGAVVWRRSDEKYLLLQRSAAKDFAPGEWECVTGRVDQGESFSDAVRRETAEELGAAVEVELIVGTAHFHRGPVEPEREMLGVHFGCSLVAADEIRLSQEHSASRWVTAAEAEDLLPDGHWLRRLIARTDLLRRLLPEELRQLQRAWGFEI